MKTSFVKLLRLCPLLLACALASHAAWGQDKQDLEPTKPGQAPSKHIVPAHIDVADVPGLPRVLIIGDSISEGYLFPVREKFKGVANVHHPTENCGDTGLGLQRLDVWLGKDKWDVIHFNFGLHDLKYLDAQGKYVPPSKGTQVTSPKVYEEHLRLLVARLKATGAKLVFATITPVPAGSKGRVAGDEKVYNAVAMDVMKELNVPVDDLCAYVVEVQKKEPPAAPIEKHAKGKKPPEAKKQAEGIQLPANVHFTEQGYNQLAEQVAASIQKLLSTKP